MDMEMKDRLSARLMEIDSDVVAGGIMVLLDGTLQRQRGCAFLIGKRNNAQKVEMFVLLG